jgi:hypothetical protein
MKRLAITAALCMLLISAPRLMGDAKTIHAGDIRIYRTGDESPLTLHACKLLVDRSREVDKGDCDFAILVNTSLPLEASKTPCDVSVDVGIYLVDPTKPFGKQYKFSQSMMQSETIEPGATRKDVLFLFNAAKDRMIDGRTYFLRISVYRGEQPRGAVMIRMIMKHTIARYSKSSNRWFWREADDPTFAPGEVRSDGVGPRWTRIFEP